eukprot:8192145-Ditylum_brightwellii.AAC.1
MQLLPFHGWKEDYVYTIYKDEIEKLQDNKQEDFVKMNRETMRSLYKELKVLARETVHCILTMEILRLQIASPTRTIQTVQEFTTFVNFFMKTAFNTNEVVSFFKTFLFPVQYFSFNCNTGWHKRLVEDLMMKRNLKFANKEHYKGNNLRMLCKQEKNTAIKNKNWQMKDYTGMYIDLTKPKDEDTGKDRTKGLWNDYFIKWDGQDKEFTLENALNTARDDKKLKESEKYWEAMVHE